MKKRRGFDVDGSLDGGDEPPPRALVPVNPARGTELSPSPPKPKQENALELHKLSPEAQAFAGLSKAPETIRAYTYHWRVFDRWCGERRLVSCPAAPATVADYIAFRAEHGVPDAEAAPDVEADLRAGKYRRRSTRQSWKTDHIATGLCAIGLFHEFKGYDSPRGSRAVKTVWEGIRRVKAARPERKAPISVADLRGITKAFGPGLRDARDKALLLLGFSGALRRSELAALEVKDLVFEKEGIRMNLVRHFSGQVVTTGTKTNLSGGKEETLGIPNGAYAETCPVLATKDWLSRAKITEGRVFRSVSKLENVSEDGITPQTVALIVKDACEKLGLKAEDFSGHSLRAGLLTAGAKAGKPLHVLQKQSRHESVDMLMRYIREAGIFEDNAAGGLGL